MSMCISSDYNGFYFNGLYLARELVSCVLSHLDLQALKACRKVCRQWRLIIDDPYFWKHKVESEGKKWPNVPMNSDILWSFYASVYYFKPFERNLIQNPYGKGKPLIFTYHMSFFFIALPILLCWFHGRWTPMLEDS